MGRLKTKNVPNFNDCAGAGKWEGVEARRVVGENSVFMMSLRGRKKAIFLEKG